MTRILTGIFFSLLSFMTYATVSEEAAAPVELPPSDATGLVGFLLVMIAMVGGYAWYIAKQERERKQRQSEKQ